MQQILVVCWNQPSRCTFLRWFTRHSSKLPKKAQKPQPPLVNIPCNINYFLSFALYLFHILIILFPLYSSQSVSFLLGHACIHTNTHIIPRSHSPHIFAFDTTALQIILFGIDKKNAHSWIGAHKAVVNETIFPSGPSIPLCYLFAIDGYAHILWISQDIPR